MLFSSWSFAAEEIEQPVQQALIEAAIQNDWFSKRCRGVSINKYFNEVNRLYIERYGFSAHNYIERFQNIDYSSYKEKIEQAMQRRLIEFGGCQGAKRQDWDRDLKQDYKTRFRQVETSDWFPQP
ncbi:MULTISPECIES: hypothetical protein [Thiomicrorhabdus]|uniref:YARHG domain-containing protein n=1 Tax=Thiomicrorhabdus heinhorstiae TaxID=2748010 RepID=A0ABS0BVT7_9GAMM|nr:MULTISPECIES: hypothetical protein [Thiomicrorhabdus]MBF6057928.1 hypothetical protein [Thiomicrorhabdus heinhorstiae]